MKKVTKQFGVMAIILTIVNTRNYRVFAYTENDLREVMGYERYDRGLGEKKVKQIRSENKQDEIYNHLLDEIVLQKANEENQMDEIGDESLQQSMEYLVNEVATGSDMDFVIKAFTRYDTLHNTFVEEQKTESVDLKPIDQSEIDKRKMVADTLEKITNTKEDIGKVGEKMKPFVGQKLRVKAIDGNSFTVYTSIDERVNSQLNGQVVKVTKDRVTIKSGETIYLTYYGIEPSVQLGDMVRQGKPIGKTLDYTMKVSMKLLLEDVNPLYMYGTRAIRWYQQYQNENPWLKSHFKMKAVKDKPTEIEPVVTKEVGIATNQKGKIQEIRMEGEN